MAALLTLAVAVGTFTLGAAAAPAHAATPTPRAAMTSIPVRGHTSAPSGSARGTGNLSYHNGPVQTGTHHTYAIYWGSNFSSTYSSLINGFFQNVAADSQTYNNVYAIDTQYSQTLNGSMTPIVYSEQFMGSWTDTSLPTTSGCTSTAGGSLCLSDAQVQAEVTKAINANGWPSGLGAEYFVFLASGISTCMPSGSCAFTGGTNPFCAYHSNYTLNGATVLYANMPYAGFNLTACGGGNYPNGDSAADATISLISHEANETITDPMANAWFDQTQPAGFEIGDKCAWMFGNQLGGSAGAQYNQVINGAHYELQQEFSNADSACMLNNYPGRGWGYVWANSPTSSSYTPNSYYQFNSTGAVNTITRNGTGSYTVNFPNLGILTGGGTVLVTAYGSGTGTCKVANWGSSGTTETVTVLCFTSSGAPVDDQFTATFTAPHSTSGPLAYVWAGQPTAASYTPDPFYQFNSAGGTNTIQRASTGTYMVRLPGLGASAGHVQVTAYGYSSDRCQVVSWGPSGTDQLVNVRCFTSSGAPDDTYFTLTFANGIDIAGAGAHTGYAWAGQPTSASYTPYSSYQFNNAGGPITIQRSGTGSYAVIVPGQNLGTGDVQVTAYGATVSYCNVAYWTPTAGVQVRCFTSSGAPLDTPFDVTFLTP